MVPVTRHEAALDRAAVQWEAEVRAAIIDPVGATLVPEDANWLRTDFRRQVSVLLELSQTSHFDSHDASGDLVLRTRSNLTTSSELEVKGCRRDGWLWGRPKAPAPGALVLMIRDRTADNSG